MNSRPLKHIAPAFSLAMGLAGSSSALAQIIPGDLIVSGSTYSDTGLAASLTPGVTVLPGGAGATATGDGTFNNVWNNAKPDASFGVTSGIFIQQLNGSGALDNTFSIPTSQALTSFSSKSEISLNFSSDGSALTFMGYAGTAAPGVTAGANPGDLDVSNSNTPGHPDASNPVQITSQRAVITIAASTGAVNVQPVNSYSGNNGRAAILVENVNGSGVNSVYTVGNAGNGTTKGLQQIVNNTGVQLVTPGVADSTVVGLQRGVIGATTGYQYGFSVTDTGAAADNSGKDNNFRGETLFNNTLYVTKGSGSQGIDSVYQVGATGTLPTSGSAASTTISILPGFPTALAKSTAPLPSHPFGLFFANANTLYVADEGSGVVSDIGQAANASAGLQKWSKSSGGVWLLDYTISRGLNLGTALTIPGGISPTYYNAATGGTAPANDGLRDLAGKVNPDGTVTLYATTSTVSGGGDQGADPNQVVAITDTLGATTDTGVEAFTALETATAGEVFRGVAISAVPEASTWLSGVGALAMMARALFRNRKK